jgi:hypothetical protein
MSTDPVMRLFPLDSPAYRRLVTIDLTENSR